MFNITHSIKKTLFFYCSGDKGVQKLNLGIPLRIYEIPVIVKTTKVPYRDFHNLSQFFHIVSTMRFFLISDPKFSLSHKPLCCIFYLWIVSFVADTFVHSSSSVLSNGCNISSQLSTVFHSREDKPIGKCNHSYLIKEFAQGGENRTQLLALSQILQCWWWTV